MQDSFKSNNSGGGGFLARAEASGGQNMGSSMRDQFDRLQIGGQLPKPEPAAAGNTDGRDWLNFNSTASQRTIGMDRPTTANSNAKVAHLENQLKEEKR